MAIKINFDVAHNPEEPTIVLAKRNGDKLGQLPARSIQLSESMNDAAEITFNVYKYENGKKCELWEQITNFKLIYCVEWNAWFEIIVELDESVETVKTIFCTSLAHAELGQIMLYDIEINTPEDIERKRVTYNIGSDDDVITAILYRDLSNVDPKELKEYKDGSILHRILEKAPHYSVKYVDDSVASIQRIFTFSDTSLYDALQEISEEMNCLFVFGAESDANGKLVRTISVHDLEANCLNAECKYRGEFTGVCPECGSAYIDEGYGKDTTIFVTSDELAESIQLTSDTGATKNCFKLEAGDDEIIAAVMNCNPNGSDYIWYFSDAMKADMSNELVDKLDSYDELYSLYNKHDLAEIFSGNVAGVPANAEMLEKYNTLLTMLNAPETPEEGSLYYNTLVKNYKEKYNDELEYIEAPFEGYSGIASAYYNVVDLALYLKSGLMPSVNTQKPPIEEEVAKLTRENLSPVATSSTSKTVTNALEALSTATANNIVLQMANALVDSRYKVKIADGSTLGFYVGKDYLIDNAENKDKYEDGMLKHWRGKFTLTAYSDEESTVTTDMIEIDINDDYETFVKRKIDIALGDEDTEDVSISGLFKKDYNDFVTALNEYSLVRLSSFFEACQACIDIMTAQGVPDDKTWAASTDSENNDLYVNLYLPYRDKLKAIEREMGDRQKEIDFIAGVCDADGELATYGVQSYIEDIKSYIQSQLDFQAYVSTDILDENGEVVYEGDDLWFEFCSFRREDKYSNDNYISDGLDNAGIIKKAQEFLEVAQKEIYKSAELQRSISASLNNLLVIDKFAPLVEDDMFEVGNYLRVMIDDEVYKLRLIKYEIDYDDIGSISVEFSDVVNAANSIKTIHDIMDQASSMATSYSTVQRQAKQGEKSNSQLDNWVENGLALTKMKIVDNADNQNITWDDHGILCREYIPVTDTYDDRQLKIINRGLYVTDDGWETSKAGIGNFTFYNPKTKQTEDAYGVIADTLVGNLILSEEVGIYNEDNSITLDKDGFTMTVDRTENASNNAAFTIQTVVSEEEDPISIMYVDADGKFILNGSSVNISISNEDTTQTLTMGDAITSTVKSEVDALDLKDGVGVESITRYYLLSDTEPTQSQTDGEYDAPEGFPDNWSVTEPNFDDGINEDEKESKYSLYVVDVYNLTDDSRMFTKVGLSSSYEAVKSAMTKISQTESAISLLATTEYVNGQIGEVNDKVKETAELAVTSNAVDIKIKDAMSNGVERVETSTGYTFDMDGLKISKSGSEMTTKITEDGMTVYRDEEAVLIADNEGVKAEDLHATTYLIIGKNSRFEDYVKNEKQRTGCFWIGITG